jgi:hypothetical protein
MSLSFYNFNVSPSCRTLNPTNFYPYEPCSHCSSLYHSLGDCPHWGQFSNFSHEQMNANFSSLGFESNSNFYNLDWSNHFDFRSMLMLRKILLPKLMNYAILIICSPIIHFPILHHMIILLRNLLWKKLLRNSWN